MWIGTARSLLSGRGAPAQASGPRAGSGVLCRRADRARLPRGRRPAQPRPLHGPDRRRAADRALPRWCEPRPFRRGDGAVRRGRLAQPAAHYRRQGSGRDRALGGDRAPDAGAARRPARPAGLRHPRAPPAPPPPPPRGLRAPAAAPPSLEGGGVDAHARDPALSEWRTRAQIESGRSWIWEEGGRILFKAEASAWTAAAGQLQQGWVEPELRSRGYAKSALADLLRLLFERTPTVCLFVRPENKLAIHLYESLGMQRTIEYRSLIFG